MRLSIQSKLFLSHFAAIILVSGSVGTYFYHSAIESLMTSVRARLQNSAALLSQGLSVTNLDVVRQESDKNSETYQDGVGQLREFVEVNPDIAFIYVMRKIGEKVVFVLDSDSDEPALPGEVYPDVVPALLQGFDAPAVDEEITTDRWGSFLSGYSPLDVGQDNYLIGIDMFADEVQAKLQKIRLTGVLSFTLSLLLALVFSRFLSQNFTSRIQRVMSGLSTIAPDGHARKHIEHKGDELAQLKETFDDMSARLSDNHQQLATKEAALLAYKDDLENRVAERTTELVEANQRLTQEIVERREVESRLAILSKTDYLTGALNRRAITESLEQLSDKIGEQDHAFCLVLVDIDHFKTINDQYGHVVGDQLLQHVVSWFEDNLREKDKLARWGGEEFLILLPDTTIAKAKDIAVDLCQALAETALDSNKGAVSITASFGVSQYHVSEALDSCIQRVDDALYEAKNAGRNQVVIHDVNNEIKQS